MIARILNGERGLRCRLILNANVKCFGLDCRAFVDRHYLVIEIPSTIFNVERELDAHKSDLLSAAKIEHPGVRKLWTVCPN